MSLHVVCLLDEMIDAKLEVSHVDDRIYVLVCVLCVIHLYVSHSLLGSYIANVLVACELRKGILPTIIACLFISCALILDTCKPLPVAH